MALSYVDPAQMDARIVRVTCRALASLTGDLVWELKADGHDESDDTLNECLTVLEKAAVGRFVTEIDDDGAILPSRFGGCAHVSSPCHQVSSAYQTQCW
jgi:hypothetical protein